MGIYALTDIGNGYASNISHGEPSSALKVLYFARKHGGKVTTEQCENFVIQDKWEAQRTLQKLCDMKALEKLV